MKFTDILSVLTGLAIFLYGMEVMGSGFKHMAGGKLQGFLEKLTKKPIVALLAGMLVTALVQSSGATTSMLVSFVNAGIMRVEQTVYVILGSNIGTTITGHLMALDVGLVAPFLAFIGVCLIMFVKNDYLNAIGEIMMGLGFVFIGMDTMSSGLAPLGQSEFFLKILSSMQNPIFGIMIGFVLTTIVQSSSASLGIIQSLAKSGLVQIKDVMYFNLGQNIGSCTTAMLASLSFNRDAKRVSIINFTFNIVNAILFTILYSILPFDRCSRQCRQTDRLHAHHNQRHHFGSLLPDRGNPGQGRISDHSGSGHQEIPAAGDRCHTGDGKQCSIQYLRYQYRAQQHV